MNWPANAVEAAQDRAKAGRGRTSEAGRHTPAPEPVAPRSEPKNEPAEKQAKLPPPPEQPGPWRIGPWELRNTTTYLPTARLVLTGRPADFEKFLAYLKAYTHE